MKNIFYSFMFVVIFSILFMMIFIYSEDIYSSVLFSISIWKDTLLPNLFPFFLISDLLIEYGFVDVISFLFGGLVSKMFNLPRCSSFPIFTSIFSGFPSGSKYVRDLLDNKMITLDEANHLIMFTHFSNPNFIISVIGILLLNNKNFVFIILFCHIFSNFIIGFVFKNKISVIKENDSFSSLINRLLVRFNTRNSFINILINSIKKSFIILVNMLGIIIFFLMITTLVKKVFLFNSIFMSIFSGILEMTQGVNYIAELNNISFPFKCALIGAIISFSGISVHFQVKSIIDGSSISYKRFLLARIIHSLLCFLLIFLIYYVYIYLNP